MALNAYLTIVGTNTGAIKGGCTQAGREDQIEVYAVDHEVHIPASSNATYGSTHVHAPIVITKPVDIASPLLQQARSRNERFKQWTLRFWRPTRSGQEEQYYTVTLDGGRIVGIKTEMLNNKYPENMKHELREKIAFAYSTIRWRDNGSGTESAGAWAK